MQRRELGADYMKPEEIRAVAVAAKEVVKDHEAFANSAKEIARETYAAKQLAKAESKPFLIKTGVALILLPDPVTTVVGTFMVAAGGVQQGIKRNSGYVDDLPRVFQSVMKELKSSKDFL